MRDQLEGTCRHVAHGSGLDPQLLDGVAHRCEGRLVVMIGGGPGERQARGQCRILHLDAHCMVRREPVPAPQVQAADNAVETIAQPLETFGLSFPISRTDLLRMVPRIAELPQHIRLAGLAGMQLEAEAAEPDILQPSLDDLQRRCFLRHEEDGFSLAKQVSDEVADRLALAGPRWSDDDEVLAAIGRGDSRHL